MKSIIVSMLQWFAISVVLSIFTIVFFLKYFCVHPLEVLNLLQDQFQKLDLKGKPIKQGL